MFLAIASYTIIRPKKDCHWTNEDLANQLQAVIPLFELYHPDCELLFAFDNSQNHHAKSKDALVANRLNLSDGGISIPLQRDTTFIDAEGKFAVAYYAVLNCDSPSYIHSGDMLGNQIQQKMQTTAGIQKGIATILQERNLWHQLNKKVLQCHQCRSGHAGDNIYCCARRLLSEQPDFKAQKEWLQDIVESSGHQIIFFPKYHCEFNFIEMIWSHLKRSLRSRCSFSFADLECNLNELLAKGISEQFVHKASRYCFRFMHGYEIGLSGPMLDYAMKKYHGHRMFPSTLVVNEFMSKYEAIKCKYESK